jgi:hypothetical protein
LVFGSLPDEYRCIAIAKITGERCRCAALQGAKHCRVHGGHWTAVRVQREAIGEGFQSTAALRAGRAMFAAIGAQNPGGDQSIIRRGMNASQLNFTDEENADAE